MSEQDADADGRETDPANRSERIARGLEKNFEQCNLVVKGFTQRILELDQWTDLDFRNIARFMRASAQTASVVVRIESMKNRGSNTK
jgi:hypothetical protein